MIKSMTGYGKAEALLETGKITVEVRSLNGKTADISIKTSMLPKDKEMELPSPRLAEKVAEGWVRPQSSKLSTVLRVCWGERVSSAFTTETTWLSSRGKVSSWLQIHFPLSSRWKARVVEPLK